MLAQCRVKDILEGTQACSSSKVISESDTFAHKEGASGELLVQDFGELEQGGEGRVDVLLVVLRIQAEDRADISARGRDDLLVGKAHPSENRSVILLGLAKADSLFILGRNC